MRSGLRGIAAALALILGASWPLSCAAPPKEPPPASAPDSKSAGDPGGQSAPRLSNAADIVAQQNHRVAGLALFAARGSAELRWHDRDGNHFEQAQVDLAWRDGGREISLRADKMGERLAWAGANAAQWWLFEPKREPSRLVLGARDRPVPDSLLPFAGPDALLELMAALPWPAQISVAQDHPGSFTAEFARPPRGEWVKTRIQVDAAGGSPMHVWLLDARGNALAESELTQPVPAEMNRLPLADRPMAAGRITLTSPSNVGVWQIFWDEIGDRDDRLKDRLFDVEVIRSVLRPAEVVDLEKEPLKR